MKKIFFFKNNFTFRIKDPSFIGQTNQYIFYFGKFYMRALVECNKHGAFPKISNIDPNNNNTQELCALENTRSKSIEIGIFTENKIDPSIALKPPS